MMAPVSRIFFCASLLSFTTSFTIRSANGVRARNREATIQHLTEKEEEQKMDSQMQYKNAVTSILSNFMQKENKEEGEGTADDNVSADDSVLSKIDFGAPKISKVPLETLASMLDAELYEKEWFVTGNVNPIYFADEFEFQDPDVKLSGIEEYARGVNKLFDQQTSRAEIMSTVVNENAPDLITVTWRLSGKVNIGPGLTIKPYYCYTDFKVNSEGLIVFQEDRFDIEQWDILLSFFFPFLIGKITSEPAPPVPAREVPVMPKVSSNNEFSFESMIGQFFK